MLITRSGQKSNHQRVKDRIMGYIKVEISKVTDAQGNTRSVKVRRFDSDMGVNAYDLNRIMHSLSIPVKQEDAQMWMVLDSGILDRDKLYNREYMILDTGTLNIDYIL